MKTLCVLWIFGGLVAGCSMLDERAAPLAAVQQASSPQCPIWQCGTNSPWIDGHGFHELNENGLVDGHGFYIASFTKDGVSYQIDVRGGRLYGKLGSLDVLSAHAGNLAGAQLLVRNTAGGQYLIRVNGWDSNVDYWATTGAAPAPKLESYLLEWAYTDDGVNPRWNRWQNVCRYAQATGSTPPGTLNGEHTLLFEGERIDAGTKTISATLDSSWFNLGCAGHTLAKLDLTGHTQAASYAGFQTTIPERQTMLKMFAADYCGNGIPFTVAGQRLSWADENGWMQHKPGVTIEARWTPSGAACLETARIDANPTDLSKQVFPNGALAAMLEYCPRSLIPRKCSDLDPPNTDPYDFAGTHLVSANPPP
jgi:hypothetical protein